MTEAFNLVSSYRKNLEMKLDPMRYEHSLSVSYTCMSLAMRYGYDMEKAELAGLLHDCGKRYSDDIILKKCCRRSSISRITSNPAGIRPRTCRGYGGWPMKIWTRPCMRS